MKRRLFSLSGPIVLLLLAFWFTTTTQLVPKVQANTVVYVNQAVVGGSNNGTSWANAYDNLQTALAASPVNSGDEIWVAAGVYKPTGDTNREATFQLKSGVALYGGFAGIETARDERDWTVNITVLSGDIDSNDITTPTGVVTDTDNIVGDNSYHVVTGSGVTNTAVLDGFVITAGSANYWQIYWGGGMYNATGSPALANVTFSANRAYEGGGMHNSAESSPNLTNVTFSNNTADHIGGGMYTDEGSPTLTNVTFNGNSAGGAGGGIYSSGSSPVLTNVTFSNNSAYLGQGGGLYSNNSNSSLLNVTFAGNWAYEGGGMFNIESNISLTNTIFSDNGGSSGGGMYNLHSSANLTNVIFSGNSVEYSGGGLTNVYSNANLTNATFSNNTADYNGGGMHNVISSVSLVSVIFSGNSAHVDDGGGGGGGGMYNYLTSSHLLNVTFSANSAYDGGGVFNSTGNGNPILTNVIFSNNTADYNGGGMYNDVGNHPDLTNVTFSGNTANGQGGGIYSNNSNPRLTNVTFSGNTANDQGGGMYNLYSNARLTHATFHHNSAGGLGGGIYSDGGVVTISSSIIANSLYGGDCAGSIISTGYNIDSDGSCHLSAIGDLPNTDPLLGPLADNGGYTLTHMPDEESPALDAGNLLHCPLTDQRGMPRPYDKDGDCRAVCDIGAVEYHTPSPMSLVIQGPVSGVAQASYAFTAVTSPISVTQPILYVWQTTDQTPITHTSGITDTAAFSWNTPGAYILTATADNQVHSATACTTITILYTVYLPITNKP